AAQTARIYADSVTAPIGARRAAREGGRGDRDRREDREHERSGDHREPRHERALRRRSPGGDDRCDHLTRSRAPSAPLERELRVDAATISRVGLRPGVAGAFLRLSVRLLGPRGLLPVRYDPTKAEGNEGPSLRKADL